MNGTVKSVMADKGYGFIRDTKGLEYFFHREEFNGHWDDLVDDFHNTEIRVEFEKKETPKGLRAIDVIRTEHPNAGR